MGNKNVYLKGLNICISHNFDTWTNVTYNETLGQKLSIFFKKNQTKTSCCNICGEILITFEITFDNTAALA